MEVDNPSYDASHDASSLCSCRFFVFKKNRMGGVVAGRKLSNDSQIESMGLRLI